MLISASLVLLWRRRWLQAAVFSLVCGVFAAAWLARTHAHTETIRYDLLNRLRAVYLASVHWSDVPQFVQTNLDSIAQAGPALFATSGLGWPRACLRG